MPRLFALDQNFPTPIVDVVDEYMVEAELVPISRINEQMATLEDWEVLLALANHDRPWDGLITNDSDMLALPKEMSVLCQTKLTLVVAEAAGHDPLKSTGLLLAHLPHICTQTTPTKAQMWRLRTTPRPATDPWEMVAGIAERQGVTPAALYQGAKLDVTGLARDPLAP